MKRKILSFILSASLSLTQLCLITTSAEDVPVTIINTNYENNDDGINDNNKYVEIIKEYMIQNNITGEVSILKIDGLDKVAVVCEKYDDHINVMEYIKSKGLDENRIHYGFITYTAVTEPIVKLWGDANCDDQVDLSDAVMIMQALANPNMYGVDGTAENHLTEQGKFNGDIDENGLTVGDAQAIQYKLLGIDNETNEVK